MSGAFRLARIFGIDIFVHWSWGFVALMEMTYRAKDFSGPFWNMLEYVALFAIVLCHELGHALACRSVGGRADQIVLWPLGGIAYVDPPERPGAVLWSIAAGPLVNVAFIPLTLVVYLVVRSNPEVSPDVVNFFLRMTVINGVLLIYNLLPFYPLDGGQILRSLLWFIVGRARSLMAATFVGLMGAAGLAAVALHQRQPWLGVLSLFNGFRSYTGFQRARALRRVERAQRRPGVRCPSCTTAPPMGPFWACPCGMRFDIFGEETRCPGCKRTYPEIGCTECTARSTFPLWMMDER